MTYLRKVHNGVIAIEAVIRHIDGAIKKLARQIYNDKNEDEKENEAKVYSEDEVCDGFILLQAISNTSGLLI